MRKFVKWWLPVVVWMGVIFFGSSIGDLPQIGDDVADGVVHRAAHVLEFAALGALLLRAMCEDKPATKREMVATLVVVAVYGISDEFHQRFTPGRTSEGSTVLFDVAGGLIGVWVWRWWVAPNRKGRLRRPRISESAGQSATKP